MQTSQTTELDATNSDEHHHYYPGGTPVTPQARVFGFDMPVYVSDRAWKETCLPVGGKNRESMDKRIWSLLESAFKGLGKRMAKSDDFVSYTFKHWYTDRARPKAKKKNKIRLGGRLLLHPEDNSPWLLIYDAARDNTSILETGDPPDSFNEGMAEAQTDVIDFASPKVLGIPEPSDEILTADDNRTPDSGGDV